MDGLSEQLSTALGELYSVESLISRGGMSTVFRALDLKHGRLVAVKVLHADLADGIGADRFLREIRLVARLQHPHILPLFDSGSANGLLYYIMPFVEGETLRQRLSREGPLSVESAVAIASEVCNALAHAHDQDILHRDVKPENILLRGDHAFLSDFGIARAIHVATRSNMTGSGMVVGTPAYMSPEQASGERDLDGRSDVYSLGCVLYEMLTGGAPHAAASPGAIFVERFRSDPIPITLHRTGVPAHVDRAVQRALARDPAQRFETAEAFGRELRITSAAKAIVPTARHRSLRIVLSSIAAVTLLAVAGFRLWSVYGRAEDLDESLFVVLPLAHQLSERDAAMGADDCSRLLFDAFARWAGLRLVDEMRVRDAVAREGGQVSSLAQATRVARRLRAGRLVWGNVISASNSIEIRAAVYNVVPRLAQPVARENARVDPRGDVMVAIASIADSLVIRSNVTQDPAPAAGSRNLNAVLAYVNAKRALDRWDLDSAYAEFSRASALDGRYAEAHLWAAQLASWQPGGNLMQSAAHASAALSSGIRARDRSRAQALLSLARGEPSQACAAYGELIQRDSADFAAWYGRGECLARDRVVERDRSSPSGWRFRTSRHASVDAYARALTIVPSFQLAFGSAAVARLEQLLLATPNEYIRGYALSPDTVEYGAFPGLIADTLSAIPWPLADLLAGVAGSRPPTYRAALDRNRGILVQLTGRWAADAPQSARAHEAFAVALENVGRIDTVRGVPSALAQIAEARRITGGNVSAAQLALTETRLLLKLGRWAQVKALADSMLRGADSVSALDAGKLAPVALLTGRTGLSVQLATRGALYDSLHTMVGTFALPTTVAEVSFELTANVMSGGPAERTRSLSDQTRRAIRQALRGREMQEAEELLLAQPLMFAYPETGALPEHRAPVLNSLLAVEAAHSRRDNVAMRAGLQVIAAQADDVQPGDLGPEFVFLYAWLQRASGDTAEALNVVSQHLASLPSSSRYLLANLSGAGGFVRLLMLRADLAHDQGDRETSARYADAVMTLWKDGDSELQPHLVRMKSYRGS